MASCTYGDTTATFTKAYDGTMLVQEFQTNAQTGLLAATATYMQGPLGPICRINETNQTEGYYPAGVSSNTPLARGVTRWYVYDGLGSKIAELDDNNNMTSSGLFDVYGLPRVGTQQGVAASSSQDYVGTLGHVTDQSTGGLIYMQARYYDPSMGRFVSEDPARAGANWYVYCGDNPDNKVDATGKDGDIVSTEEAMGDSTDLDGTLDESPSQLLYATQHALESAEDWFQTFQGRSATGADIDDVLESWRETEDTSTGGSWMCKVNLYNIEVTLLAEDDGGDGDLSDGFGRLITMFSASE